MHPILISSILDSGRTPHSSYDDPTALRVCVATLAALALLIG